MYEDRCVSMVDFLLIAAALRVDWVRWESSKGPLVSLNTLNPINVQKQCSW